MTKPMVKPPSHLKAATKKWWLEVAETYELEGHHIRLLTKACEAWDRAEQARVALAKAKSLTYEDRFGAPRKRPEVGIERDCMISFARLVRELGLDSEDPGSPRPPTLARNGGYRNA